jgi:hypothetical protein
MEKNIKDYLEEWADIMGYEGLYQVSCYGRIKSLPKIRNGRGSKYLTNEKILNPTKSGRGYLSFIAYKESVKPKRFFVHVLVGKCFILNPKNKPEINHIDGNKLNNSKDNLEWVTSKENINHAFNLGLNKKVKQNDPKRSKQVMQLTDSWMPIAEYPSVKQVERSMGFKSPNIFYAIKNKTISYGYYWKYAN